MLQWSRAFTSLDSLARHLAVTLRTCSFNGAGLSLAWIAREDGKPADDYDKLQWSRAFTSLDSKVGMAGTFRSKGFNGAGLSLAWIAYMPHAPESWRKASMEPGFH